MPVLTLTANGTLIQTEPSQNNDSHLYQADNTGAVDASPATITIPIKQLTSK
jgi:hypothetical protein